MIKFILAVAVLFVAAYFSYALIVLLVGYFRHLAKMEEKNTDKSKESSAKEEKV